MLEVQLNIFQHFFSLTKTRQGQDDTDVFKHLLTTTTCNIVDKERQDKKINT